MLGSALGACTLSVMQSWASNKDIGVDDLKIDVSWTFAEGQHRVESMSAKIAWPSLSAELWPRVLRRRECVRCASDTHACDRRFSDRRRCRVAGDRVAVSVPVVRFTVAGEHTHEPNGPAVGEPGRRYTVIYDGYCRYAAGW